MTTLLDMPTAPPVPAVDNPPRPHRCSRSARIAGAAGRRRSGARHVPGGSPGAASVTSSSWANALNVAGPVDRADRLGPAAGAGAADGAHPRRSNAPSGRTGWRSGTGWTGFTFVHPHARPHRAGSPGVMPRATSARCPVTFWNLIYYPTPECSSRSPGTLCLVMVVGHQRPGRSKPGCATSRGTCCTSTPTSASASPYRTSSGPARSSSPRRLATVYWWTLWVLGRRGGGSSGESACLLDRTPAPRPTGHVGGGRKRTTSSPSTSPGARLHRLPVAAGQFLNWRFLTGPGWGLRPPLLALRGPGRAQPADHRQGARRRQRARPQPAPRYPRRSSRAPTTGSPNGPAPGHAKALEILKEKGHRHPAGH